VAQSDLSGAYMIGNMKGFVLAAILLACAVVPQTAHAVDLWAFSNRSPSGPPTPVPVGQQSLLLNGSVLIKSVRSGSFTNYGEYSPLSFEYDINDNTPLGGLPTARVRSAFFIFDLSEVDIGPITSAVLSVEKYYSHGPVDVAFKGVSTDASAFDRAYYGPTFYDVDPEGAVIFASLQSGPLYASTTLPSGYASGGVLTLDLNGAALDALNQGEDDFIIGVSIPTTYVPEPSAWLLMLAGFGAVGGAIRGRRGRAPAVAGSI